MTGSSPIRILTVDDHPLVRDGISGLVGLALDVGLGKRIALRLVQGDLVYTRLDHGKDWGVRASTGLVLRLGDGHP